MGFLVDVHATLGSYDHPGPREKPADVFTWLAGRVVTQFDVTGRFSRNDITMRTIICAAGPGYRSGTPGPSSTVTAAQLRENPGR
jgi:hypothetical protein